MWSYAKAFALDYCRVTLKKALDAEKYFGWKIFQNPKSEYERQGLKLKD